MCLPGPGGGRSEYSYGRFDLATINARTGGQTMPGKLVHFELPADDTGRAKEAEDTPPPEDEAGGDDLPKPEKPTKPKELTFMDLYARSRGFRWHDGERCTRMRTARGSRKATPHFHGTSTSTVAR